MMTRAAVRAHSRRVELWAAIVGLAHLAMIPIAWGFLR